ncbi:MAG TPA: hypothetical protein VFD36_10385 [Kofleriaceae bacterium]|jgi:hypothetical protein|nr:hypothetical protein [Kofleriaceae bacterium]
MTGSDHRAALTDEVERFQAKVRELALAAVREVLEQELERKLAKRRSTRSSANAVERVEAAPPPPETPAPEPAAEDSAPKQPAAPPTKGGRVPWTRETIVSELASHMTSGTEIDAAFLTRHGPPGLVAAARRVFGRFEAAMNVAALHFSNLYPDGPPAKPGQALVAAAQSSPAFRSRRTR